MAYSDDKLIEAVMDCARSLGVDRLTIDDYNRWRLAETQVGRTRPTSQTILNRFGWTDARLRAGLMVDTPRRTDWQEYDEDQCLRALARVAAAIGHLPSESDYKAFYGEFTPHSDVPSPSPIRLNARRRNLTWKEFAALSSPLIPQFTVDSEAERIECSQPQTSISSGRLPVAARKAVELRAMDLVRQQLEDDQYVDIADSSATRPWDFEARDPVTSDQWRIEVKGTTTSGDVVELTKNEVENARVHPHVALVVVTGINLDDPNSDTPTAEGGEISWWEFPWRIDELGDLAPTMYRYSLRSLETRDNV